MSQICRIHKEYWELGTLPLGKTWRCSAASHPAASHPLAAEPARQCDFFLLCLPGHGSIFLPAKAAASKHSTVLGGSWGGCPGHSSRGGKDPWGYVTPWQVTTCQRHPKIQWHPKTEGRNNAKLFALLVKTGIVRFAKQTVCHRIRWS